MAAAERFPPQFCLHLLLGKAGDCSALQGKRKEEDPWNYPAFGTASTSHATLPASKLNQTTAEPDETSAFLSKNHTGLPRHKKYPR